MKPIAQILDEAAERAMGNLFDVLLDGLMVAREQEADVKPAIERFNRGWGLCKAARDIAEEITKDKDEPK